MQYKTPFLLFIARKSRVIGASFTHDFVLFFSNVAWMGSHPFPVYVKEKLSKTTQYINPAYSKQWASDVEKLRAWGLCETLSYECITTSTSQY